jgi:L-asparaginase
MNQHPRISLIFTGGTISMAHGADGSAVPALTGADIRASVPGLDTEFELESVEFGRHPGPHMDLARMLQLRAVAETQFEHGSLGVVIAHGTDTLEETAFLLDLLHNRAQPVVLVGAMRTRDELSWDGPVNLFGGALVAADAGAASRGVLVAMNSTVHAAAEVTKTFTEAIDTFATPDYGPLGIVELGRVIFYRQPLRRFRVDVARLARTSNGSVKLPRVELVEAAAGCDGMMVRAALDAGAEGLVIGAMGRGNLPPPMAEAVIAAVKQGVPVVVCSRCWGGRVAPVYGYEGGGAKLHAAGAIFSPWLGGLKSRIALTLALSAGMSAAELRAMFDSPVGSQRGSG